MSARDYPTEEELETIRIWKADDLDGLMNFIKDHDLWMYADSGFWKEENDEYHISTAGWSGNEDIIAALQSNHVWWMFFWQSSKRGGHYVFGGRRQ